MENIGFGELLIIIFIIVLLFGGKKIPELAKGLGEGVRSFKRGLRGDDEKKIEKETEQNKSTDEKS
ncbi:MAG: twin-arginine translocase TatA/TatE family subunit [Ignavibacteriales bacterium]|jgi:sec-independent protein translocase protein TatA|nr:twin-arginine translocase TatA/TatE family subunit [Ignavibacteriales bacterium]